MKLKKSQILTGLWAIVIAFLSLLPPSSLPNVGWENILGFDKLGHLGVYFILSFFLAKLYKERKDSSFIWKSMVLSSLFGLAMETLQLVIYTGRNFEILDIIANIIGSILGSLFLPFFTKKTKLWKD